MIDIKIYLTEYRIPSKDFVDGVPFSSSFFAENDEEASLYVKHRNLPNEKVVGYGEKFTEFDNKILDDFSDGRVVHLVVHSMWIYARMLGFDTACESLRDDGIVHETVHIYTHGEEAIQTDAETLRVKIRDVLNIVYNLPQNFWNK